MTAPVSLTDWRVAMERAVAAELIDIEVRRTRAMALLLGLVAILLVALAAFIGDESVEVGQRVRVAVAMLIVFAAYEAVALRALQRWGRLGIASGWPFRVGHTAIEVSFAPAMVAVFWYMGRSLGLDPVQALFGAPPLLAFVPIVLSALYLDFRICAFAGALAAVEFALLHALMGIDYAPPPGWETIAAPTSYLSRSILYLAAGLAAGFVAHNVRRQMEAATRSVAERDRAVSMFGQHVSPQVAELLLNQPMDVGGEEREVCIMFLDIRDFSKIASEKTPQALVEYLNTLFGELITAVNARDGIVNKFLGDGFMAVFGAPIENESASTRAVEASFEMLEIIERLNAAGSIPHTRVGIGLHIGGVVTGNVGSHERKEYTIIGDAVNLAARIEQATKLFGAQLLVSAAVQARLEAHRFEAEDLGDVELKGQSQPAHLYRLA